MRKPVPKTDTECIILSIEYWHDDSGWRPYDLVDPPADENDGIEVLDTFVDALIRHPRVIEVDGPHINNMVYVTFGLESDENIDAMITQWRRFLIMTWQEFARKPGEFD